MQRRDLLAAGFATLAAPALAQSANSRVLRFVPQANLTSLDPIWTTAAVTENHGWTVFDTLYGMTEDLKVRPQMADSHTVSDDGLTWLIKLRDGLLWHDGEPRSRRATAPPASRAGAGATPSASRSAPWWKRGKPPTTAPSASA